MSMEEPAEASPTDREGDEPSEPRAKRAKTEGNGDALPPDADPDGVNAQLAEIFGEDVEPSGLERVLAEAEAALSDAESAESFFVDEPRLPDEATEFGIPKSQLDLVKDIFGDTSVLRPIVEDEPAPDEDVVPAAVHASLGAAEATAAAASSLKREGEAEDVKMLPVLPVMDSLDPDVLEKSYQLPKDQEYTTSQEPERWLQFYTSGPAGSSQDRSWTDEEYQNEARWLFLQLFNPKGYQRDQTEDAIILVLTYLHEQRLEMLYILEHLWWKVSKVLTKEDLWSIQEFDLQWQPLWTRYQHLQKWVDNVEEFGQNQQLPEYIKRKTVREVWQHQDAETHQRDAQEWLQSMHPAQAPSTGRERKRNSTSIDAIMEMARKSKFDEKLGIVESIDIMSLQALGITPAQLGDNVQAEKQVHRLEEEQDNKALPFDEICESHADPNFHNAQAVKDGITTFLVRLIASEPRVRSYVRQEFWKLCAVSAKVTEAGKALAKEASHSFKKMYRSFHVTYRPVSKFDEKSNLFLEMLQLQRKGMITIDYDLVQMSDDYHMSVVVPCTGRGDRGRLKQTFTAHCKNRDPLQAPEGGDAEKAAEYHKLEDLIPKMEAAAKLREAHSRRRSSGDDLKSQVTASFQCAGIKFEGDALSEFMVFDPIFEQLSLMYCVTLAEGDDRRAVYDTAWNGVRRNILRKVLMEELYPTMWAEVKDHLSRTASAVVCRDIRERLTKMVDVKPPPDTDKKLDEAEDKVNELRQDSDDEAVAQRKREDPSLWKNERDARKAGLHSALVILPEVGLAVETAIVGFVNAFGEPVDMRQVFKSCLKIQHKESRFEKGSFNYDKDQVILEHKAVVENMIATHKPSVILLAVTDPEIMRLKAAVETLINREQKIVANLKVLPKIKFVDPTVPRAVAYHKRVLESPAYRDYPMPAHRIAISCARFFQDPLAETCQLWHELPDENGLFKVNLHHLQHDVPRELLGRTITQTLQEVFAKCGLYINKVRRSPHLESLIQFVPGLGPRKARIFHKALTDSVKSRATVQDIMSKQLGVEDTENNAVLKNMFPFIKIQPDFRDGWYGRDRDECASLERVRIAPQLYHWVNTLCKDALAAQSEQLFDDTKEEDMEGDVVGRVMDLLHSDANFVNVIQDQDWGTWHERAGEMNVPDAANLDKLFETILEELQEPYKDNRQVEENEMPGTDMFYLATAERTEAFAAGSVVRGSV